MQRRNERFLRGRLLIAEHLRSNAVRRDRFFVEYDAFLIDRPANRLLRSALEAVKTRSRVFEHQKLCRELLFVFEEVPKSTDFRADFARCDTGRGMAPRSRYLVTHREMNLFGLEPDFGITRDSLMRVILDAKWKLVDASKGNQIDKYDLKQPDFYQMYAYGQKYLDGTGELFLIYPQTRRFPQSLKPFHFGAKLTLHVVPFDMNAGKLEPTALDMLLVALRMSQVPTSDATQAQAGP